MHSLRTIFAPDQQYLGSLSLSPLPGPPPLPLPRHEEQQLPTRRDLRAIVNEQEQILKSTFYRRPLPSNLTSFTSPEGKRLFRESLNAGYSENYFALAGTFTTQSEPAYCGLGSLAMVLNALEVDPKKRWKGGWRWYSDEMLECCAPLQVIKQKGVTFREFSCLAKCNGLHVISKQADQVSLDEFMRDLKACTSNGLPTETHMVVSFSRKVLGQTGDGHFSPVTSFHPESNQVLVLDTARFKYPSYYVKVEDLYRAMQPVDTETQLPRGYFLLQRREQPESPLDQNIPLCTVSNAGTSWVTLAKTFCSVVPRRLIALHQPTLDALLEQLLEYIPRTFSVRFRDSGVDRTLPQQHGSQPEITASFEQQLRGLMEQVTSHPLFPVTHRVLSTTQNEHARALVQAHGDSHHNALSSILATILLMSIPRDVFVRSLPPSLFDQFESLRARSRLTGGLRREVDRIHDQIQSLTNEFCECRIRSEASAECRLPSSSSS
ncbi:hypothetical protein RI367_001254 [Sorochytrium milnesiophthora]